MLYSAIINSSNNEVVLTDVECLRRLFRQQVEAFLHRWTVIRCPQIFVAFTQLSTDVIQRDLLGSVALYTTISSTITLLLVPLVITQH